jgi:sugar transferase (PEP-CTERM system associated)
MPKIGGQQVPSTILLLAGIDSLVIAAGLLLAIVLRFHDLGAIIHYLRAPNTLTHFLVVILICECVLYYNDLYDLQETSSGPAGPFVQLLQSLGLSCLALAILSYFAPDLALGRGINVLAAVTIFGVMLFWRLILGFTGLWLHSPERVLVLGTGPAGIALVREIIQRPELNLKVVGFLDEKGENIGKSLVNPGIIGAVSDVNSIVSQQKVDRVVLSLMERRGTTPLRDLLHLKFAGVGVEEAHSFNERITGRILVERLSPSSLILAEGFRKSYFQTAVKRTGDMLISFVALVLTLPVMSVIALAIWLETGSPIFYRQKRTGLGGREFDILKFRSMVQNAEGDRPCWAADVDNRITRVGRFIRNCRLDELPQVFNVFRGEMSLVGPRPERPYFCKMLEEKIPYYALRQTVRPGITGWAQVKYQYGASIEESKVKLEHDLFYIKHLSFMLDLAILFETAKVILNGRGAK